MATFTAEEKSLVLRHYGVPDTDAYPDAMFGQRTAVFDVASWMQLLNDTGKPYVMRVANIMEGILFGRMPEVTDIAEAAKLGQITIDATAFQKLEGQYAWWQKRLRMALNPAEERANGSGMAGSVSGSWTT